jgi:hypothetical protein
METTARDHNTVAEDLGKAATSMDRVHQEAEDVAETIKRILDDAAAQPVVQINESTNEVIPPETDHLDEDAAARVAAKVADLQQRIATALADGERVDADLAGAITAAAGTAKPEVKTASSLEDLLVPDGGARNAPKPGEPAPGPDSLDVALDQLTGQPGHQPASPGDPAAGGPGAPVKLDPAKVEQFKALARQAMLSDGVPPDQIEQRLDAAVAAAQRPRTPYTPPEPEAMPPPGFGDGFADRWFATEEGIRDLLGVNGFEKLKESWEGAAISTGEKLTNPLGPFGVAVDEVKHALDSPSAAYYLGEKAADGATTAPALIFGPEAALGRGALDDLARAGAIPRELIDSPTPAGTIDHPTPASPGDIPGGHGAPGGNPLPFDVENPLPTARPEFNLANPLDHMSPELRVLSEQHLTGSGETVLGPYAPVSGGDSYIKVAEDMGASYFDIGDAWYASTPTQQLAANQHVLDTAIANGDTIKLSVPYYEIRPDTYTGAELRYIQEHGYQRIDDTTFVPPNRGGEQ